MESLNKVKEGINQDGEMILIQKTELKMLYKKIRDYEKLIQCYEARQQNLASSSIVNNKAKLD